MIRQLASRSWRREIGAYLRFLARHDARSAVRRLLGAADLRRQRRHPPIGLRVASSASDWPGDSGPATTLPVRSQEGAAAPLSVPLATTSWLMSDGDPWDHEFTDPEDNLAAHRFGWIPQRLAGRGAGDFGQLFDIARRWLARMGQDKAGPGWDTYSVAERTTYFSYLASAGPHNSAAPQLLEAIGDHSAFLLSHLEFRGPSTNNHLINDGRALYLASLLTGDTRIRAAARELLAFGARTMFVSGFLREGATHYQVLLTRTFLEVLAAARVCGDAPFARFLEEWSGQMVTASRFLQDGNTFPLIGDLCPDFPPEFVVPFATGQGGGWGALLDADIVRVGAPAHETDAMEAGFFKTSVHGWRLLAWVNPLGHVAPWSHAHADLGSFVAEWHGRPLLVDAGRSTYSDSPLGRYGQSVRSHNAISIDGHEPCVVHGLNGFPELMAESYLSSRPHAAVTGDGSQRTLRISHGGFGRLGDGLEVSRSVAVSSGRLVIRDELRGSGRHKVETFFHFAHDVAITQDGGGAWCCQPPEAPPVVLTGPESGCLIRATSGPDPTAWQALAYGQAVPATAFVFTYDGSLPVSREYVIRQA